jgi:hypothetical protein
MLPGFGHISKRQATLAPGELQIRKRIVDAARPAE